MGASFNGRGSTRNTNGGPTSAITTMNPRGLTYGTPRGVTQLQPQTVDPAAPWGNSPPVRPRTGNSTNSTPTSPYSGVDPMTLGQLGNATPWGNSPPTNTGQPNQGSTGQFSTNPTLANGQPNTATPTPAATAPRPAATRPTGAGYGTPATTQNWINPAAGEQVQGPPPTTTNSTPPNPSWVRQPDGRYYDGTNWYWQQSDGSWVGTQRASAQTGAENVVTQGVASTTGTAPTTTPPAQTFSTADYFRRALGLSGSGTGSAVLPPSATQNFTTEQIAQGLGSVTTPTTWEAPPEGMFTAPSTPDTNTLLRIGGPNGPSINPTQVQNIINNRGTGAAMETLQQDLAYQSPAAQLANAVRQQQTSQAALPEMFQDLRNVPQLYANPVTRALLPAEIRQAEEARLNGGPDWRTASFGDAIDGNTVTRAVPTSDFRAPTGAAPTVTPAQRQQNLVADFVNSYLPYMNNPGSRGLSQQYNITELNSALAAEPAARQAMVANRLTGLTPQQLQVALQTSGLTLPQFLSQAVARLAG